MHRQKDKSINRKGDGDTDRDPEREREGEREGEREINTQIDGHTGTYQS